MAAQKNAYWMVLGKGRPSVQHASESLARTEAERLAKAEPGQKFVVLKAEAEYVRQPEPVDRTELVMPKTLAEVAREYSYVRPRYHEPSWPRW